jgi:hypothetical protein
MPQVNRRIAAEPVGLPGLEPINEPLFDTQNLPLAGTPSLRFFGQGIGVGGQTQADTNLPISGALPNPQQFHCYGVQLVPQASVAADDVGAATARINDIALMLDTSFLRLFIGTKSYFEVKTVFIPSGHGLIGAVATTITDRELYAVTNGVPHQNNYYDVTVRLNRKRKPIHIPPQQAFRVELNFPVAQAFSAAFDVSVFMIGIRWREIQ